MKKIRLIIIAIVLLANSGCFFPVFVPVHDGHEHHGHHYDRDDDSGWRR